MIVPLLPSIQTAIDTALDKVPFIRGTPIQTALDAALGTVPFIGDTPPLAKKTSVIRGLRNYFGLTPQAGAAPLSQDAFYKTIIYGSADASAPIENHAQQAPTQRVDAYADRVLDAIDAIETGSEGERNVKFQQVRQFLEPAGYFSGGLMADGYDPHEKITVNFNSYVGLGNPDGLTNLTPRTYFAWEIAAGALAHDKVERGGPINYQSMHIDEQDKSKVTALEAVGNNLQRHWENDVSLPMRDATGELAQRSGIADAYVVRGTLQSLVNDKVGFGQLSQDARETLLRTLHRNGQVILPNIYGYPLAGYAFVPFQPYDGNAQSRPHKGVMIDLKNGAVTEIWDEWDFASWAKKNRDNVLRSFNGGDRQGRSDAHWPKAGDVLDNLIIGNYQTYPGRNSVASDKAVPVWETFNYTESRGGDYRLRYGNLNSGLAANYQEVNANNAVWSDQTQVFGSSQQNWKAAKDLWSNTFGYVPVVGNAGNIVFGIHDAVHGMTAADRLGGTAAAVISGLQLAHELAPALVEAGLAEVPTASAKKYTWSPDTDQGDLELLRAPSASPSADEVTVKTPSKVNPTPEAPAFYAGMREIEFRGKRYFASITPDGGDGMHYILRLRDPEDPSGLLSSGIVAKPDEAGVWRARGVVGGGQDVTFIPLESAQASETLDAVIAEYKNMKESPTGTLQQAHAKTLSKLINDSNAEDLDEIVEYNDKDTNSINESLRAGERTDEVDMFLEEFGQLNNYEGKAYRSAFVTAEGAEKIKQSVGSVFKDEGVQSASATVRNVAEWESWATEQAEELGDATQQVVYVFDESIPKKNLSTGFVSDHVAVPPGEPMQVLAVQEVDNKLFVYLSKPSKVSGLTYNLYDGSTFA
ncbi:hypothetical protein [Pseudomonas sp. D2002]|uniref:hypothetical protein n=1 Tax=Pseudomonas sp. D2002 TaxID=2726980 RepID=UPI0015A0E68E|nr:hypothetical protein [Pseudomonas sp. D2002]NWA81550.1 hypothetical protein [Pseudomonas sp. D2002]